MSPSHDILRAEIMRELIVQHVVGDALRAAITIVEHSFALGRDAAQFNEQRQLAALLGWTEDQCSRALRELRDRHIVSVHRHAGAWHYELRPCGRWQEPAKALRKLKVDAERVGMARAAWEIAKREAQEDPRQPDLIPASPAEMRDGGFGSQMMAASRAEAAARGVDGPSSHPAGHGPERGSLDGASTQPLDGPSSRGAPTDAGVRAGEHVHEACSSATQSMSHEHEHVPRGGGKSGAVAPRSRAELCPANRELYDWIEELTGEEEMGKFRKAWLGRIQDHSIAVFSAISETKIKMRNGTIHKTPGCALNDAFKRCREAQERRG